MTKYDFRSLTRKLNLIRFFRELENCHSEGEDASRLAERERELAITDAEWNDYYLSQQRADRELQEIF